MQILKASLVLGFSITILVLALGLKIQVENQIMKHNSETSKYFLALN